MTGKKMGICKGRFTLREFTRSMHTLVSVLLPQSRLDQFMIGHWFQNYDTICVRFFATYNCDFSCFVGFFPKYVTIFFSNTHIYAHNKSHICALQTSMCVLGHRKSRRVIRTELYGQQKTTSCTMTLKSNFSFNQAWPQWQRLFRARFGSYLLPSE